MSIPHRCPVCEGRGEVGKRLAQVGAILISEKPQRFKCHGCTGTGIVWDNTFTISQPWITNNPSLGDITFKHEHQSGDCPGVINSKHTIPVAR